MRKVLLALCCIFLMSNVCLASPVVNLGCDDYNVWQIYPPKINGEFIVATINIIENKEDGSHSFTTYKIGMEKATHYVVGIYTVDSNYSMDKKVSRHVLPDNIYDKAVKIMEGY